MENTTDRNWSPQNTSTSLCPTLSQQHLVSGEDFIAASICFLVSFIGLLMNGTVSIFLIRLETMRHQFAYLCISLAAADCGVLMMFAFWTVPMTFTQNCQLSTGFIGKKVGQIGAFFWFGCLYSTLAIAVNRLLAISYPVLYKIWFSTKNTLKVIGCCWILAGVHVSPFFFNGCDFFYMPSMYIWKYAETTCGTWVALVLDFIYGVVFFILIFILNIITALKLKKANQSVAPTNGTSGRNQKKQDNTAEKRRKQEVRFFIQACINALLFELLLISFHGLSHVAKEKWGWFFTTTFFWQVSHASNGFLTFFCNPPLRSGMAKACCCIEEPAVGFAATSRRIPGPHTIGSRYPTVRKPWDRVRNEGITAGENPMNGENAGENAGGVPGCILAITTQL